MPVPQSLTIPVRTPNAINLFSPRTPTRPLCPRPPLRHRHRSCAGKGWFSVGALYGLMIGFKLWLYFVQHRHELAGGPVGLASDPSPCAGANPPGHMAQPS